MMNGMVYVENAMQSLISSLMVRGCAVVVIEVTDDELITEDEWFRRMMQTKVYDVLTVDWNKATTRVVNKYTGEIFDVTSVKVGRRNWLKLHKLV